MNTRQTKNPTPNIPRASGCAAPAGKTGIQGDLSERARVACFSASLFSRKEKARSSAGLPKRISILPGVRNGQARSLQRPSRSCIQEANHGSQVRARHARIPPSPQKSFFHTRLPKPWKTHGKPVEKIRKPFSHKPYIFHIDFSTPRGNCGKLSLFHEKCAFWSNGFHLPGQETIPGDSNCS